MRDESKRPTKAQVKEAWNKAQMARLEFEKVRARHKGAAAEILHLEYQLSFRVMEIMEAEEDRMALALQEGLGKQFKPPRVRGLRLVRKSLTRYARLAGIDGSPQKHSE